MKHERLIKLASTSMNFRIFYFSMVCYSLISMDDVAVATAAEKCYVSNTDTGEGRIVCVNIKEDSTVYNETLVANNLTQMLLLRSELSVINSNFFDKFAASDRIKILTMLHGNLSAIEGHSFESFKQLHHLNLSFNRISDISDEAFADNINLKSISLMSNEIRQLKVDTFKTLVDLESVELSRNRLRTLDKHIFLDNANLVNLDAKFNHLKEISGVMFHALPALESLDLSYNEIETLPPHAFKYNYVLDRLNLQGNKIKFLDFALVHLGLSELNLLENPLDIKDEKNRRVVKHLRMSNMILKVINHFDRKEDEREETYSSSSSSSSSAGGEVNLKTNPQLKPILVGIITFLIVIMVLLSVLLYQVHQRTEQRIYKRYYHDSCRSIEHLQSEEQNCLTLSISRGQAFFHNHEAERAVRNNDEEWSADSCSKKDIHHNINY